MMLDSPCHKKTRIFIVDPATLTDTIADCDDNVPDAECAMCVDEEATLSDNEFIDDDEANAYDDDCVSHQIAVRVLVFCFVVLSSVLIYIFFWF